MISHVIVTGSARSGTTLLMESMWRLDSVHVDNRERRYDTESRRYFSDLRESLNVNLTVSKRPGDCPSLASTLATWPDVKALVIMRDGRDAMCSKNPVTGDYMANPRLWHSYACRLDEVRHDPRVYIIRYESFVLDPDTHMEMIAHWLDTKVVRTWAEVCEKLNPDDRLPRVMNGIRPVDTHSVGQWKKPEHRKRLKDVGLTLVPQLIAWGYAADDQWYRDIVQAPD